MNYKISLVLNVFESSSVMCEHGAYSYCENSISQILDNFKNRFGQWGSTTLAIKTELHVALPKHHTNNKKLDLEVSSHYMKIYQRDSIYCSVFAEICKYLSTFEF